MSNERIDARRHRQALLDAASAVFLEHGITAPLDLVVERAGVGRATLYRHFPDRVTLVLALVDRSIDRLEMLVADITHDGATFGALLNHLADILVKDPSLADFWRVMPADTPERKHQLQRFCAMGEQPIRDAIAAGTLRPDFTPDDMLLVGGMLGAVAREPDAGRRHLMAARQLQLLCHGLKPANLCPAS